MVLGKFKRSKKATVGDFSAGMESSKCCNRLKEKTNAVKKALADTT